MVHMIHMIHMNHLIHNSHMIHMSFVIYVVYVFNIFEGIFVRANERNLFEGMDTCCLLLLRSFVWTLFHLHSYIRILIRIFYTFVYNAGSYSKKKISSNLHRLNYLYKKTIFIVIGLRTK